MIVDAPERAKNDDTTQAWIVMQHIKRDALIRPTEHCIDTDYSSQPQSEQPLERTNKQRAPVTNYPPFNLYSDLYPQNINPILDLSLARHGPSPHQLTRATHHRIHPHTGNRHNRLASSIVRDKFGVLRPALQDQIVIPTNSIAAVPQLAAER
jgi:hypothetical protein